MCHFEVTTVDRFADPYKIFTPVHRNHAAPALLAHQELARHDMAEFMRTPKAKQWEGILHDACDALTAHNLVVAIAEYMSGGDFHETVDAIMDELGQAGADTSAQTGVIVMNFLHSLVRVLPRLEP